MLNRTFTKYIPWQNFEEEKIDQSRKGFLSVLQGVKLSKTQNPTTTEDTKRMKVIPYASAIDFIKYAMLCTRSIVYPTLFGKGVQ